MRRIRKPVIWMLGMGLLTLNIYSQNPGQQAARNRMTPNERAEARQKQITEVLERVYQYLEKSTPAQIVHRESGEAVNDLNQIDEMSVLERGDFGITTYEWGVTYSGMLKVAEIMGDARFADYTRTRLQLVGESYPYFRKVQEEHGRSGLRGLITPMWLDDCGSMGAAMMKASLFDRELASTLRPVIDNAFDFVMYKEYRLEDGILARMRPTDNSVWLDDMYMGITPIAYMAKLIEKEDPEKAASYYDEAVRQIELFTEYLWIPEMNLFRHGWIEKMEEHPSFYWARANGWAILTICDVLDVLPHDHQARESIVDLLRKHIRGIAVLQSGEGLWHQLLNRNDSYLETSATAMFTYCIAHAINEGWIDEMVYAPVAHQGWNGVVTKVNEVGQVEDTCVGTGLDFTHGFYYKRPVSVYAAHGYGPVLLAGAEMIRLTRMSIQ